MDLYDTQKYKDFVAAKLRQMPKRGHGQLAKMAEYLGTNSSLMSQIFSGDRDLTEDQALKVAQFFGLNKRESYYFVLLVQMERAGVHDLKALLREQIEKLQQESKSTKNRIQPDKELSFEQQAVYYSNWLYVALHTLTSIKGFHTLHELSEHLQLPVGIIKRALDILVEYGLCLEQDGEYHPGSKSTFIPADSPLVIRHHANWRVKALESMSTESKDDFYFTAAFSLSEADFLALRLEFVKLVEKVAKTVNGSPKVEQAACLNLDYFKF